jgi:hypothetical protein
VSSPSRPGSAFTSARRPQDSNNVCIAAHGADPSQSTISAANAVSCCQGSRLQPHRLPQLFLSRPDQGAAWLRGGGMSGSD